MKQVILLLLFLLIQTQAIAASESSESSNQVVSEAARQDPDDNPALYWKKQIESGPDQIFYFAEAVSGKKLRPETYKLLLGVNHVVIQADRIVFQRADGEEVTFSKDSVHGSKFFEDWEKSKLNLEQKFGAAGKNFLESVDGVLVKDDRIEVQRRNKEEFQVELGERKLHHAFDLRALRFKDIRLAVDKSDEHPYLKDIEGVSAVLNMPGFSFPVEVKEFRKIRMEKQNDIKVGVRNPVPGPMRALLFLPSILRFHFLLSRKD